MHGLLHLDLPFCNSQFCTYARLCARPAGPRQPGPLLQQPLTARCTRCLLCAAGAGGVNFGTKEGPWNHAARLQQMPHLQFTHIIDPNLGTYSCSHALQLHRFAVCVCYSPCVCVSVSVDLAQQRVRQLSSGPHGEKWQGCAVHPNHHSMLASDSRPDAVIIGIPPDLHGALHVGSEADHACTGACMRHESSCAGS